MGCKTFGNQNFILVSQSKEKLLELWICQTIFGVHLYFMTLKVLCIAILSVFKFLRVAKVTMGLSFEFTHIC